MDVENPPSGIERCELLAATEETGNVICSERWMKEMEVGRGVI